MGRYSNRNDRSGVDKKSVVAPRIYTEKEIKKRWDKKTGQIETLANNIQSLRYNITKDLQSYDEKEWLTALVILTMEKTGERVGNESSAANDHRGITGLLKKHITIEGNTVTLKYTGKSGVKHQKMVTDSRLAENLKKAIKNSPSSKIFCTSEGFEIKADRVNRYLKDFDVTAKDLRGYSANRWILERLGRGDIPETDKLRKKEFLRIAGIIAERVGHSRSMLRNQYLIPQLETMYVDKGVLIDIKDSDSFKKGGSIK